MYLCMLPSLFNDVSEHFVILYLFLKYILKSLWDLSSRDSILNQKKKKRNNRSKLIEKKKIYWEPLYKNEKKKERTMSSIYESLAKKLIEKQTYTFVS